MEPLHLIVGLGNPGAEYAKTRHNAGFLLVEKLAARWQADWKNERKFNARMARAEREGSRVLLCQPQTFMNSSGEAVGALMNFYQLPLDADAGGGGRCGFAAGRDPVAARAAAAAAITGWNPSSSIWARANLRGCGSASDARTARGRSRITCSAVLTRAEAALMEKVLDRAAGQAECWLDDGIQKAMNQFNGVVDSANEEKKQ